MTRETLDWTDRILELEVGPVAHGGHCVARADGRVVFVRHALPGERVRAVVTEDGGGSFCRADAVGRAGRVAGPGAGAVRLGAGRAAAAAATSSTSTRPSSAA